MCSTLFIGLHHFSTSFSCSAFQAHLVYLNLMLSSEIRIAQYPHSIFMIQWRRMNLEVRKLARIVGLIAAPTLFTRLLISAKPDLGTRVISKTPSTKKEIQQQPARIPKSIWVIKEREPEEVAFLASNLTIPAVSLNS